MVEERDWQVALSGIHEKLQDTSDDIADLRTEVRDVREEQRRVQDQLQSHHEMAERDRRFAESLHQDHETIRETVKEISASQRLASQNSALMQRLNDQTHKGLVEKHDQLYEAFASHAKSEDEDRRKLFIALLGIIVAMVGGFVSTAVMVLTKIASAVGAGG